ncbi:hypothetical protein F5148DRAFT_454410 [Russula earlei]|uniref:Uncharacterized protein n=1 Tax=Russula earlei TaxID=71964 RepID=A0ACC0TZ80_9AGAM|nr:hypothetical protein F5148DRAFT_454410 [Russula earlei]
MHPCVSSWLRGIDDVRVCGQDPEEIQPERVQNAYASTAWTLTHVPPAPHLLPTVGRRCRCGNHALSALLYACTGPPRMPLPRLAHRALTISAPLGIFLGAVCLVGAALPRWSFHVALSPRCDCLARIQGVRGRARRAGCRRGMAQRCTCVWRVPVLWGAEDEEVLRACGDEGMVKEEELPRPLCVCACACCMLFSSPSSGLLLM